MWRTLMARGGGRGLLGDRRAGSRTRRLAAGLFAITTLAAAFSTVHGAGWIGIYSAQTHADREWCFTVAPFTPVNLYIYYVQTGDFPQANGAEYKIEDMPGTFGVSYIANLINGPGTNLNLGNAFDGTGHNGAWPAPQPFDANGGLHVATYSLVVLDLSLPINGVRLRVSNRTPPTNAAFECPLITDAGFNLHCVGGLTAALNDPPFCVDAVDSKSWSEIRTLYR